MKNLISMTDFVLEQGTEINTGEMFYRRTYNYASFLKQPLELWMFVPCKLVDGVWVVLEKPTTDGFDLNDMYDWNLYDEDCQEYQQAKERCLFEGFEISKVNGFDVQLGFLLFKFSDYINIEKLIDNKHKINLQLTAAAQKQSGV